MTFDIDQERIPESTGEPKCEEHIVEVVSVRPQEHTAECLFRRVWKYLRWCKSFFWGLCDLLWRSWSFVLDQISEGGCE